MGSPAKATIPRKSIFMGEFLNGSTPRNVCITTGNHIIPVCSKTVKEAEKTVREINSVGQPTGKSRQG